MIKTLGWYKHLNLLIENVNSTAHKFYLDCQILLINVNIILHLDSRLNEAMVSLSSLPQIIYPMDIIRLSCSILPCNEGSCQPTSWNALITLVLLPREPVWYSILLLLIPPISFTLDTWHLHNGLAPSPISWNAGWRWGGYSVCVCTSVLMLVWLWWVDMPGTTEHVQKKKSMCVCPRQAGGLNHFLLNLTH